MASNANSKLKHVTHGFGPIVFPDSNTLILGSFPSVKSREQMFYYGHPMNRFWKVLSAIYHEEISPAISSKIAFLSRHQLALYDVIEECDIRGSSDASILNPVPADLASIIEGTPVRKVILNGKKAGSLFCLYQLPLLDGITYEILPSTSPANAACSLEQLVSVWKKALFG